MGALRRWLRQRNARRLAVAMRDAFVPLGRSARTFTRRAAAPPARGARGTSPTRAAAGGGRSRCRARAREDAACLGRPRAFPCPPELGEARAEILVAVGCVEEPPDDELRRDGPVPVVLLQPARDVEQAGRAAGRAALPGRTRSHYPRRAPAGAPGSGGASPRPPSRPHRLGRRDEQRDVRVSKPERREAIELLGQIEREVAADTTASTFVICWRSSSERTASAWAENAAANAGTLAGSMDRPAAARWPPKRSSGPSTRREPRGGRSPGSSAPIPSSRPASRR